MTPKLGPTQALSERKGGIAYLCVEKKDRKSETRRGKKPLHTVRGAKTRDDDAVARLPIIHAYAFVMTDELHE